MQFYTISADVNGAMFHHHANFNGILTEHKCFLIVICLTTISKPVDYLTTMSKPVAWLSPQLSPINYPVAYHE